MPLPTKTLVRNMADSPIVELEQVSFSYPHSAVLKDISFTVHSGQFIGIIGPNGGGKTTLLKLILGFLKPSQGTIRVLGVTAGIHSEKSKGIAYVPQALRCDRDFPISAEEVVLSGLTSRLPWYGRFRTADRMAARRMLENMDLGHLSTRPFGMLSGGQAQRVLMARALVSEPSLLLLDEPTAGVDSQSQAAIYGILNQLKGKMTLLMVTHDLRAAIEHVETLFCIQGHMMPLKPEEVCRHVTLGLYEPKNLSS